ncbi:ABC transporter permease subunit [bacterium]|nr:ABC transporter permease subunit [bacterium]
MLALFWRTIKDRKYTILAYCLAGILLLWMYVALFPSIKEQAQQLQELMKTYPESLLKAFDIESPELSFTKLENFLSVEQFSFVWPIMLFALTISWAGSSIAGEIEKKTIEILLSQPISRLKIFLAKYLSGISALIVFTAISIFSAIPLASLYNIEFQTSHYLSLAIVGFLLGWATFSLAMFFSALFSEKGKVYFVSVAIIVAMYVVNIVSSLKNEWNKTKYFSFFHYYDPSQALINNQIENLAVWVFLGVAILFTLLAIIVFSKRDIAS